MPSMIMQLLAFDINSYPAKVGNMVSS